MLLHAIRKIWSSTQDRRRQQRRFERATRNRIHHASRRMTQAGGPALKPLPLRSDFRVTTIAAEELIPRIARKRNGHIATRESTQAMADDLFAAVLSGAVKIPIDQRYALADVQQAHRDLEARKTTGCTILTL